MNIYYVYAYIRKSNNTPYYIGKGKGRRAFTNHRYYNKGIHIKLNGIMYPSLSEAVKLSGHNFYYVRKYNEIKVMVSSERVRDRTHK